MFGFIFSPLGKALGGALVVILAFAGVYHYGRSVGRHGAAMEALEVSVKVLRERKQIDEEVSASDAASLCGSFGLSDDEQRECVRRLATPDNSEGGNSGLHRPER